MKKIVELDVLYSNRNSIYRDIYELKTNIESNRFNKFFEHRKASLKYKILYAEYISIEDKIFELKQKFNMPTRSRYYRIPSEIRF